jgi:hypothetical protein
MLEYYKLALIKAGHDKQRFIQEFRNAMSELQCPEERRHLKVWFKNLAEV